MKKNKFGLLPRIILAIILGILCGNFFPLPLVRVFETFNSIFSQFLGFIVPLIIVGLVVPAIADIGKGAGRLLLVTVILAYLDTVCAGFLSYGTGSWLFPDMIANSHFSRTAEESVKIMPYFTLNIPPLLDVMSGLIFSFVVGLCITMANLGSLRGVFNDFKEVITITIGKVLIPLLPLYIFGVFLNMTHSGQAYRIMLVFAQIIIVIFVLHVFILLYQYFIAGALAGKNPLKLLATMIPAYLMALGTSSSAATIPVTLKQTIKNGVREEIAGFVIPLNATIHLSGSAMKITACALAICLLEGLPHDPLLFVNFILMLSIMMVAAPGVPGGAIMAALAPLASILGFNSDQQASMIALYIAMDSFGTACNVTGDGAIAVVIDRFFKRGPKQAA
ncbi:dicarboxylate/amino acid:cation symporter [Prevotella sp. KH2C16]|uniref:dicarboxylate/amino acid:cation symporter n=1 Tax=Prevotella sp. KH2C16 TaxID=1855325 RepID=UPI0008EAEB97|nr:dicarboxylate/amino acid:cation symporter [Prevotella sp. KH2C16]SFF82300.1 Na+/H+-dicarboxylate symporter [Prevotella sp. KH2C16]